MTYGIAASEAARLRAQAMRLRDADRQMTVADDARPERQAEASPGVADATRPG